MPSLEATNAIAASLGRIYGAAVQVHYFDLRDTTVQATHAALLDELREQRLPFPAVFLDGELLYAGSISPLRVVAAVAQELERRGVRTKN